MFWELKGASVPQPPRPVPPPQDGIPLAGKPKSFGKFYKLCPCVGNKPSTSAHEGTEKSRKKEPDSILLNPALPTIY